MYSRLQHPGWPLSRQCEIPWQFPDGSQQSSSALAMLSVTHIMPVLVLNTCMDANMQFTINSFRHLFPNKIFFLTFPWFLVKSLIFPWQLSNSLTFPGFPDKWSPWTSANCTISVKQLLDACGLVGIPASNISPTFWIWCRKFYGQIIHHKWVNVMHERSSQTLCYAFICKQN